MKKTCETLSPGLKWLLLDERDNYAAIDKIAADPSLVEEARKARHDLEDDARRPGGNEAVKHVIGRRFVLYPQPARAPEEWAAWWGDYYAVLAHLPEQVLDAAMIAWARTAAEFLPKPGQILALAEETRTADSIAAYRAKSAVAQADKAAQDARGYNYIPPVIETPLYKTILEADKLAIRKMRDDFRAQLPERKRVELKPISAKVGPTGVSPELKALVERQRAER